MTVTDVIFWKETVGAVFFPLAFGGLEAAAIRCGSLRVLVELNVFFLADVLACYACDNEKRA